MWGFHTLRNNTAQKNLTVNSDVGSSIPLHRLQVYKDAQQVEHNSINHYEGKGQTTSK